MYYLRLKLHVHCSLYATGIKSEFGVVNQICTINTKCLIRVLFGMQNVLAVPTVDSMAIEATDELGRHRDDSGSDIAMPGDESEEVRER